MTNQSGVRYTVSRHPADKLYLVGVHFICWIAIYPLGIIIRFLNNRGPEKKREIEDALLCHLLPIITLFIPQLFQNQNALHLDFFPHDSSHTSWVLILNFWQPLLQHGIYISNVCLIITSRKENITVILPASGLLDQFCLQLMHLLV